MSRTYPYSGVSRTIGFNMPDRFSGEGPSVGLTDRPSLALWFERDSALPGETLKLYINKYGGARENTTAVFNATLVIPSKPSKALVRLNTTPEKMVISTRDMGVVSIKVPPLKELQKQAKANLTNRPMILEVVGVDEEGASGKAMAWIYGAGVYEVLSFVDINLPLPGNPQEENVLGYMYRSYMDLGFEGEKPLKAGDYRIEIKVLEKERGKEIHSESITQERLVLSHLAINMSPGKEYVLSYRLRINGYEQAPVYVRDVA